MNRDATTSGQPGESAGRAPVATAAREGGTRGRSASLVAIGLALLLIAGTSSWWLGIRHREYDNDEVQRAHSIWLASLGLRPYRDFFECHPPYFAFLSPILKISADPGNLLQALRGFSALGNALFLSGLIALAIRIEPSASRRVAWLGVLLVAFDPRVLDYLVEFRIDGWGYALATWSLYRFRGPRASRWRHLELGFATGIASAFFCPKLVLLPPLVVVFELATSRPTARVAARDFASYVGGVGLAGALLVAFLVVQGIGIGRTLLLLGRYHTLSNANAAFDYGLARQLGAALPSIALILSGVVATAVRALWRRSSPDAYACGLAAWLILQAALVTYPYKQYYAPWLLFASLYVVILVDVSSRGRRSPGAVALLLTASWIAFCDLAISSAWTRFDGAGRDARQIRALALISNRGDFVVAHPPAHPIFRRDSIFLWFNTSDPKGYDSERIFEVLAPLRPLVTPAGYASQLEAHPPAFIVLERFPGHPEPYPRGEWEALIAFCRRRGYREARIGSSRLAVRPDRFEEARRRLRLE